MGQRKRGVLKNILKGFQRNKLGELLVARGMITHSDLRNALKVQKITNRPLGQVFLENKMISRWQLGSILSRQVALRVCTAALLLCVSFSHIAGKKARADMNAGITLVSASAEFSKVARYPALLGTSEKRDGNLSAFTKWTGMFKRFDRELKNSRNLGLIQDWQSDIRRFEGQSMKQMARNVNNLVNQKPYILDKNNWGKSDYWATPVEFLKRGGDCEDFAIAKYTALRSLGFPEERLRVAIVQDTQKNIPHAVLVVYTDQGAYILDNQIKRLVNAETRGRYEPIFSINRTAWWLHSKGGTVVASAR